MTQETGGMTNEEKYIHRKLGYLTAKVEAAQSGTSEVKAHSIETRAMLNAHIQEARKSAEINDQRWAEVAQGLGTIQSMQEVQRVLSKLGNAATKLVSFLKSLLILTAVGGIVYVALSTGDFTSAITAVKLLLTGG